MSRRMVRAERREKAKSVLRVVLVVSSILLVIGLVYQAGKNTINAVSKINRASQAVQWGCIEDKLTAKAIVINKELALKAEYEGHFENLIKEHEKVKKDILLGNHVAFNKSTPVISPVSGILSLQTDGLEEILSGATLQTISPEAFDYKAVHPTEQVYPGQGVCKIVDNLSSTQLIVRFAADDLNVKVDKGQHVKVYYEGNELALANIKETKKVVNDLWMILDLNNFHEELMNKRYIAITVVFESSYGFVVPKKALVDKGKEKGIYCIKGEDTLFKPIKILVIKDETAVVEGLNKNDIIVIKPW